MRRAIAQTCPKVDGEELSRSGHQWLGEPEHVPYHLDIFKCQGGNTYFKRPGCVCMSVARLT